MKRESKQMFIPKLSHITIGRVHRHKTKTQKPDFLSKEKIVMWGGQQESREKEIKLLGEKTCRSKQGTTFGKRCNRHSL